MSFGIYAVGYLILIAGVAYLAHLMHIPSHFIAAIALIMLGIGVVTGVQVTVIRNRAKTWRFLITKVTEIWWVPECRG